MDYKRDPSGIRFAFTGLKTNSSADSMPRGKSPYAQNVRGYSNSSVQTRPPMAEVFPVPSAPGATLALEPTLGIYKTNGNLISSGAVIDNGYAGSSGASLIPFRPNASPAAYGYVFDPNKSTKVLIPSTVQKIGIAEPQAPCDASTTSYFSYVSSSNPAYAQAGTASAPVNGTRLSDTAIAVFPDPAFPFYKSVTVSPSIAYSRWMAVAINSTDALVEDVYPPQPLAVGIAAIYYYSGTTGRCVVVPNNLSAGPGTEGQSLYEQNILGSLRRGSIVQFSAGEQCFVLNTTTGPNGTICFEVVTSSHHTTAETFTQNAAIRVLASVAPGNSIVEQMISFNLTSGIGTQTSNASLGPVFVNQFSSFQPQDYIHISVLFQFLASLNEFKILFDVGDGSFTQNFYFYTVRASDVQAAVDNTLTQLGAAQLVEQRAIIDDEQSVAARNQGNTVSGDQTTPGDMQWAEIIFPISALTRVGNDQTKTLQNVGKVQFLFNANATTNVYIAPFTVFGQFQPDVADTGEPYRYVVRPRSSVTGAQGNPCPEMRYGVNPRRESVQVNIPSASYDGQIDTLDVFRFGGSLTSWRKVGQVPSSSSTFLDNYSDDAIVNNETLDYGDLEPFPTIGTPLTGTVVGGAGMAIVLSTASLSPSLIESLLPGNEIQIGQQLVYTLWARPTAVSGGYLFQLQENADVPNGQSVLIQEPLIAARNLPYVWGPDVNGVLFAVGDQFRAGSVSRTRQQNPDSALDAVDDLCPPTEPLQNGVVMDGLSFVASPSRWWSAHTGQDAAGLLKYNWLEVPVGDGLAAPFGICTDGRYIYFVGNHGIMRHSNGPGESLTDADLYNLFPHEGIAGVPVSYGPYTTQPPNYAQAALFRLSVSKGFLYFVYAGVQPFPESPIPYYTLVMNTETLAWQGLDQFTVPATIFATSTLPGGSQDTYMGDQDGEIWIEDLGGSELVGAVIATNEEMPDVRAQQMWGDASVDIFAPSSAVRVQPVFLGNYFLQIPTVFPGGQTARQSGLTVNLLTSGPQLAHSMGLIFNWGDSNPLPSPTTLYSWQPSFVPQPEDTTNRWDDWDDCGSPGAKFIQGCIIMCDSANVPKNFKVESSEDLSLNTLLEMPWAFNGQSEVAFSLAAPFIAHLVRLVPQDLVVCRKWSCRFIFQPAPESVFNWQTQGTSHGFAGFFHAQRMIFAYSSTAAVALTITAFDGTSPSPVILPSTGGAYKKLEFMFTPNKGRLFFYQAESSARWRPYLDDCEIYLKPWGSTGPYVNKPMIGDPHGNQARI